MPNSRPFKFDSEKAVEVILCLAVRAPIPDTYHICKLMYFADKFHLGEYGRFICGDWYVAMKSGPTPSRIYDVIKTVRGDDGDELFMHAKTAFLVRDHEIIPLREPNLGLLSESEIEAIDNAIKNYGDVAGWKLKQISHDAAYESADLNDEIPIEAIARTLPNAEQIIELLVEYR